MTMTPAAAKRPSRLLFFVPVLLGAAGLVWFVKSGDAPEPVVRAERVLPVRVLRVEARDVVPRTLGYGTAAPSRVWRGVAQVAGRVVARNQRLEVGAVVAAGTLLVEIDPREYDLTILEIEATIGGIDAQLVELATREENTRVMLEVELRVLQLTTKELERRRELHASGDVAAAEVDAEERAHLAQRARVQELQNALRLLPPERQKLEADRRASETRQESARLDLGFTQIAAPFDCRIVAVDVEETQFASVGQVLLEAHGIDAAEVFAQVPLDRFRALLPAGRRPPPLSDIVSGAVLEDLGLSAMVRLRAGEIEVEWEARVDRIDGVLDPETRTLGVVVVVDAPYEQVEPGVRPPLVKGMFCEVELRGRPKPGRIVIPRSALHGSEVYVMESDRLQRRRVVVDFALRDFVCLREGLDGSETVVLSDPLPAIDGMLLEPVLDEGLAQRLAAVARGEGAIR